MITLTHYFNWITSLGGHASRSVTQFIRYTLSSSSTFAFDLFLLWIFTDILKIHYIVAIIISFMIAITVNYMLSRTWAFKGTHRSIGKGYIYFLLIALSSLLLIIGLMIICVDVLHMSFITSRITVGALVGIWNFLMNKYVNLKVH
ncbi:MAG: GtrA family protein [Patescibacteria group bacterium]